MLTAYNFTIFIKSSALRKNGVPRDILELEFSPIDSKGVSNDIGSPRVRKDGSVFYLATEGVAIACMNRNIDWLNEIAYLESFGLRRIYDFMPIVPSGINAPEEILLVKERRELENCHWLKLLKNNYNGQHGLNLCKEFLVNQRELEISEAQPMGFSK